MIIMPKSHWVNILNSVRAKTGKSDLLMSGEVPTEIDNISGGYGDIPSYHFAEAGRVIGKIRDFKASHPNSLVFGTVSDIHVCYSDTKYTERSETAIKHASFALETVGAMAECDFIANLGDNGWENGIDTANGSKEAHFPISALKSAFERVACFNLVGNHDKSNDTQGQFDLIGSFNSFDNHGKTQIRGYGYKDYTEKKVRVIVLNTCDYLNASGGCALSYEQKDFLLRALDLSAKSNASSWQILLLSHIPLDWNGGDYNYYNDLQVILRAYESGTVAQFAVNSSYALNETPSGYATYSNGTLTYNYSGKNVAKIIANIHGHVHTNKIGKIANTEIARVATVNTNPDLNKTESYSDYGDYSITSTEASKIVKVAGTAKDTSATFYCIDLNAQTIYAYGYGADIDRTVVYKDAVIYSISYSLTNATSSNTSGSIVEGNSFTTTLTKSNANWAWESVKVTMGGVDITSTAYNSSTGVVNITKVTGNIVITAKAKAPYTNVIDTAGTEDGVRLRSGGTTGSADGFASGFFTAKGGDVIRVYFPNGNRESINSNGMYCVTYASDKATVVTTYNYSTSSTVLKNATDKGYEIHIPSDVSCVYARVAGAPTGGHTGWVVTVNEEIKL